jgi:ABC-type dipeptide/oligopeptide/nickel transport system ATPase component
MEILNIKIKRLELKNGPRIILNDYCQIFEKGKIYAIIGKNGAGKSVFLKAITNLLDKTQFDVSGNVLFENTDLLTASAENLTSVRKNRIQYVFQDPVNSLDHLKRISYYFKLNNFKEEEIREALFYFRLPDIKTLFRLYPYELSGGMAQRVVFILALLKKPDLLILDEPTSGIDAETVCLIKNRLSDYITKDNGTILLVTQDIDFAKGLNGLTAFMSKNGISEFSEFEEFLKNPPNEEARNFLNAYERLYYE